MEEEDEAQEEGEIEEDMRLSHILCLFGMIMVTSLAQATFGINGLITFLQGGLVFSLLTYLGLQKLAKRTYDGWQK
jgi:hypothetical protein